MKLVELTNTDNVATPNQYKELGAKLQSAGFQFNKSFFGNKEPGRPLNIRATEKSKEELQTALKQVDPSIILKPADKKITGSNRVDGQMFELNGVKYYIGVGMTFGDEGSKITIFGRKALTPTVLGLSKDYSSLSALADDLSAKIQSKFQSPVSDMLLHILGNARNKRSQTPLAPELAKIMNQQNVYQSVNQDFGEVLGAFVLGKENDKVEFPAGNEALVDLKLPGQNIAIKSLSGSANAFTKVRDLFDKYEETKGDLAPFSEKAYLKIAPHVCITLKNGDEMCGTSIRNAMKNLDEESFEDLMGWFDKNIYDMLKKKTSNVPTSLSETIFELVEEVLNEKIKKVGSKHIVYPKSGGKRLGTHDTEKAAKKQLAAIEISKQQNEIRTGASVYYGSDNLNKTFGEPKKIEKPKTKISVKKQKKSTPELDREEHQMDFEFEDLDELSAMGAGAVQGSSGNISKRDEDVLIREGIPGIKIKTTLRVTTN